ncbi:MULTISPECIES: hypoxanthine-guanine phosphoribosyltransferase [unclassified Thioalkalivibrio]|uniref:hypoxanthine-guanine phosphoribosyltransferase n=1 Tax=unclassified Thioalkalivibrio TaxID=2621013 RepID=UPI000375BC8E|nr:MULTISPECIES: hypoxanthine-guanine phosphoribosyltransferase [unclassified Thioalkalivibrio]
MNPEQARATLRDADCLYSRDAVETAIDRLAERTARELADENPLVLGVMNGGVVLLGGLLTRWSFPMQVDYLHATRYRGATRGEEQLHWLSLPHQSMQGRTVVIVDDILDGGITLAGIQSFCQEQGARRVVTIVLVDKANPERDPSITVDHAALEAPNRYLFGYGMDYQDYLRNAPGIFAVADH